MSEEALARKAVAGRGTWSEPFPTSGGGRSSASPNCHRGVSEALRLFPDPELLKELGGLYPAPGQGTLADQAYANSERQNERQAANGVDGNLERALASADRRLDLDVYSAPPRPSGVCAGACTPRTRLDGSSS